MKTLKKVIIEPVFLNDYMIPFEEMEDGKIYISEKYHTSVHKCLCGCGTQTVLPLNNGKETFGWNLIKENDGSISFTPSILNPQIVRKKVYNVENTYPWSYVDTYPSHHYIITKNVANFI
jgi:hypothetical protein